jgi:cytochrome bd ubiquinol oxidase subunit II
MRGEELAVLAIMWAALTAYALLGGADFGAGLWDLLAGGRESGAPRRALIEHSIGPVWEANHVWLIFVLVLMWTAFPPAFAAIASTLYIPLMLIALGVIARGSAFAFRKAIDEPWAQRLFGAAFAVSSVITPWFLGAAAGAVASGRVPPGLARGAALTSWLNPVSAVTGTFAVAACAFLAASYLTLDARRGGHADLAGYFRRRALASGVVVGALSVAGLLVLRADAPVLYGRLTGVARPLVLIAVAAGLASLALAWPGRLRGHGPAAQQPQAAASPGRRGPKLARLRLAALRLAALRLSAAGAVAAVLWAWGAAQYPFLLRPGLTVAAAAAPQATLTATLACTVVGLVLLIPSLAWLLVLFQRAPARQPTRPPGAPGPPSTSAKP